MASFGEDHRSSGAFFRRCLSKLVLGKRKMAQGEVLLLGG